MRHVSHTDESSLSISGQVPRPSITVSASPGAVNHEHRVKEEFFFEIGVCAFHAYQRPRQITLNRLGRGVQGRRTLNAFSCKDL